MGVAKPLKKLKKDKSKIKKLDIDKLLKNANHNVSLEYLHTPFKSKPCKGCAALEKGICKCARKRLK